MRDAYYKRDLALVHHLGFGFHADICAPGILELLEPVREGNGLVLELGCGSGLLTKYLVDAGHRVIATDASPAMLELAKEHAPGAEDIRLLTMPDDPMPEAEAIVSIGHAINYLDTEEEIERALIHIAHAASLFALDICDLEWGEHRKDQPNFSRAGDDWRLITRFSLPAPNKYVRDMTTFVRNDDGTWRRDDERHENILVDTSRIPALLVEHGVDAAIKPAFGSEELPIGLKVVIGRRRWIPCTLGRS
ncbi:MAG TPA: class I SAM-dependent methyltransferase [Actinomycetota bacterium]|nr:class I SAM-dependent methyltransferase [Actinomycetota bacterium]